VTSSPPELSSDDFAHIGEVIVHAAALENMLIILAAVVVWADRASVGTELEDVREEIQDGLLGETAGVVIRKCREHEAVLYGISDARYLTDLWDDCIDLFERRHAIAHSYWDKLPDGAIVAKRALPRRKRRPGLDFVEVGGSLDDLAELRDQMADAISDIKQLLDAAWPQEWPRVAAFTLRPPSRGGRAVRPRKGAAD
jgi:hypothetical protein